MKKLKKKKLNTKKEKLRITTLDFLKAIKQANRDIELTENTGFKSTDRPHKNKKQYNRKDNKKIISQEINNG